MTRTRACALAALTATLLVALGRPDDAGAGTYRAVACHPDIGASIGDLTFHSPGERYAGRADCAGTGVEVTHAQGLDHTAAGRYGAWTLAAPPGLELLGASALVAGEGDDWHSPQMHVTLRGGEGVAIPGARGPLETLRWSGTGGRALSVRLACTHDERCGAGERAFVRMRRVSVSVRDATPPTVRAGGSLLAPGSRRGTLPLDVAAADVGSGIQSLIVEVNGEPLVARGMDCQLAQGVAVRLRPCPSEPARRFEVPTTAGAFRQGPNALRVCALDYAAPGGEARACLQRAVRVDNRCPVSQIPGTRLEARFAGGASRLTVRGDARPTVRGRLTGAGGGPVGGASVCVATRTLLPESAETRFLVARTDADGRFAVRLPAGPSREVRVAHWPDATRAAERYLTLLVRARPRLRLRPQRALRNGERVRFRVALPGPANGGRRVAIQARAGGRWVHVAGGRTSPAGTWRGGYRFRSTTATRTYEFRAVVRRQPGYPYRAGTSRVARQTVRG